MCFTDARKIPNYKYVDEQKLLKDIEDGVIIQNYAINTSSFSFNFDDPISEPVVTYMLNPKYKNQEDDDLYYIDSYAFDDVVETILKL